MSYCRFENTTIDIDDCLGAIQDAYEECADLSNREVEALHRLLEQAEEICRNVEDLFGVTEESDDTDTVPSE